MQSILDDFVEDLVITSGQSSGMHEESIAELLEWLTRASKNDTVPETRRRDLLASYVVKERIVCLDCWSRDEAQNAPESSRAELKIFLAIPALYGRVVSKLLDSTSEVTENRVVQGYRLERVNA